MLKRFYIIICCFNLAALSGQVSMTINLPDSISTNSQFVFDVKINKGELSNFAKYQIDVPEGVVLEEVDSRAGTFSYENKRAKIVWVIAPPDSEFVIRMKLVSGPLTGPGVVQQKFYYIENGNRKENEAPIKKVYLYKSVKTEKRLISTPKLADTSPEKPKEIKPEMKATQVSNADATDEKSVSGASSDVLKQQAGQFREDSRKAYEIGSFEKAEAEKKMQEANDAIKNAEAIADETEKKAALDRATVQQENATKLDQTADKILSLAKTLEDNAIEIETSAGIDPQLSKSNNLPSSYLSTSNQSSGNTFSLSAKDGSMQPNYDNKRVLSQKEIFELKQQAEQFRSDAREASVVGQKEKEKANLKIQEADDLVQNAQSISDEAEKSGILKKAETLKQKAETDLHTAEKILILSITLEENANEIDKLVEYISPGSTASVSSLEPVAQSETQATQQPKSEELNQKTGVPEPAPAVIQEIKIKGLVYMVQIGAFAKSPDKSAFRKVGKYNLVKEDNKFKVLVGSYDTKADAAKKRTELFSLGFDGFVVSYQDGVRVK